MLTELNSQLKQLSLPSLRLLGFSTLGIDPAPSPVVPAVECCLEQLASMISEYLFDLEGKFSITRKTLSGKCHAFLEEESLFQPLPAC